MLQLYDLRVNHEIAPYGISGSPVFSWKLSSDERNTVQTAYSIRISRDGAVAAETGKVEIKQSIENTVPGFIAEDRAEYSFEVTVWDNHGNEAVESSYFEAAPANFSANWIEPANGGVRSEKKISMIASQFFHVKPKKSPDERLMPVTMLRREFQVKPGLKKARAYASAHGIYELSFNGQRPDQRFLAPEFTAYGKYVCYQTYDITKLLTEGGNACGVKLADGWYSGRIGITGECGQFGLSRALFLQIELTYDDGNRELIVSDESFKWSDEGVSRYADIFIGEKQDMRYAGKEAGFDTVGFDDSAWQRAVVKPYDSGRLHAQIGSPVEIYEELPCVQVITTPKGEKIVDFGQVFAGMVRMTVKEKPGTAIKLEHTEVLDHKGNYINNIMGPNKDQTDYFVTAGTGEETFEPHFTFHGFRYVKVTGLENWADAKFTGLVLTSRMDNNGSFACADARINQLYHNVRWSQLTNMISLPTDCPQRERAGWTGDFEIFTPTAVYNQDMRAFTRRWLENMEADQLPGGEIPDMIPYLPSYRDQMIEVYKSEVSAAWGDAAIIVPWNLYQTYGDKAVLERFYPMMERWFRYVRNEAETKFSDSFKKKKNPTERERENQKYLWNTGWHYGDWLTPSISKSMFTFSKSGWVTREVIAPIFYAQDALLLSKIAALLGKNQEAEKYRALYERIRVAFQETCVDKDGRIDPDLQGMYVCAIDFDMVPQETKVKMAKRLVELIEANGGKLDTGFVATPRLLGVLERFGYADVAFKLLYQEECPSWLYEVKNGATTIWENWAAIKPNGKVDIFSYNHYSFGGVFNWMYRAVGGIEKADVGFEKILIRPVTDPAMGWAETSHECVYDTIATRWERKGNELKLDVTVPCNTCATVLLPDGTKHEVGSGKYSFTGKV